MKWSLKLGRWVGIDVYLHVTFLALLGLVGWLYWQEERSMASVLGGVGFFVAVFACVLLHEFGHALTARRYGILTRDITLLPIGGVARLERMPDHPMQELWVALAGPAVNVVIAALLLVPLALSGGLDLEQLFSARSSLLQRLLMVNVAMIAFNLLPAFPMDGGRVLRALLALRMDYARATQIAATIGRVMAVVFVVVGYLVPLYMLIVIAFFVWVGAVQETNFAHARAAMGGLPVDQAMLTEFQALAPDDPLQRAVDLVLAGSQQDFPVLRDGAMTGVLTRQRLLAALAQRGPTARVEEVMEHEFPTAQAGELIEAVLERTQGERGAIVPVYQHDRLVGLLTTENIGEFVAIRRALATARGVRSGPPPLPR